jgi:hypothetical protein
MKMKGIPIVMAAFVLLLPSVSRGDEVDRIIEEAKMAKAPPAAIDAIVQKARDRGLSRNSIASILTILRDASIKGLYIDPVIDKIQEGLSKNIRPDIIERVARKGNGQNNRGRGIVGGLPPHHFRKGVYHRDHIGGQGHGLEQCGYQGGSIRNILKLKGKII